jgi:putative membrane protein insertion efficiency factor
MKNIENRTSNSQHRMMARTRRHWMFDVQVSMFGVPKSVLIFVIRIYRWTISPAQVFLLGPAGGCRFSPTCSQYALDAVRKHGALAGGALAAKRICRCHPWGGCGHDPVPGKAEGRRQKAENGIILENAH